MVNYRCPAAAVDDLVKPVQDDEIKKILFYMPTNKAPSLDGFHWEFYKAVWHVVGMDFILSVQSFFLYSFLPKSTNPTLLSLIPKSLEAERMTNYRPIACCNIVYKVISKILARLLKGTLPSAVDLN